MGFFLYFPILGDFGDFLVDFFGYVWRDFGIFLGFFRNLRRCFPGLLERF